MKKERLLNLFATIFNLAIFVLVTLCTILFVSKEDQTTIYFQYEILSGLFIGLISFICLPFNIYGLIKGKQLPKAIVILKLVAVVASLTNIAFAIINYGVGLFDTLFNSFLLLSFDVIVPILGLISFIFFDHSKKVSLLFFLVGFLIPLFYFAFYLVNLFTKALLINGEADYYAFISDFGTLGYIYLGVFILVALILSIVLLLLNRLMNKIYFKDTKIEQQNTEPIEEPIKNEEEKSAPIQEEAQIEEKSQEEIKEETVREEQQIVEENIDEPVQIEEPVKKENKSNKQKEEKKSTTKKPTNKKVEENKVTPTKKDDNGTKVYHLTKRKEDGMWAITFVGGQKAVKLFKTKKEAEEYLEVLTKNQGATALIRNSKGAKAGKFASSIKSNEDK